MRYKRSVTEIVRNFSEYISRVAYEDHRFLVTRGGEPVAELRPVTSGGRRTLAELPELLEGLPRLTRNEAEAFACDLEELRRESETGNDRDPWAS